MPCPPFDYASLATTTTNFDPTKPVYLLNLWRYRPQATYLPEHAALAGEPCTGEQAMQRYVQVLRGSGLFPPGAEVIFRGKPVVNVVAGPDEHWDMFLLNKYPTLQAFRDMVESEEYKTKALPHRLAGQEDTKLIVLEQN